MKKVVHLRFFHRMNIVLYGRLFVVCLFVCFLTCVDVMAVICHPSRVLDTSVKPALISTTAKLVSGFAETTVIPFIALRNLVVSR